MASSLAFRRAAALALLVLLAVVIWRVGAAPLYRAWHADREAVQELRDAIARLRGLAASRPAYERALAEARQASGITDALMISPSATLAAADLQQRVKALVEGAGGALVSVQPTDPLAVGPFTQVGLSVRMIVSTPSLQRVLHALETGSPVVVVEQLLVLARGVRAGRRGTEMADELDVRLQLSAFVSASLAQEQR